MKSEEVFSEEKKGKYYSAEINCFNLGFEKLFLEINK